MCHIVSYSVSRICYIHLRCSEIHWPCGSPDRVPHGEELPITGIDLDYLDASKMSKPPRLVLLFVNHVFACLWFLIGSIEEGHLHWVHPHHFHFVPIWYHLADAMGICHVCHGRKRPLGFLLQDLGYQCAGKIHAQSSLVVDAIHASRCETLKRCATFLHFSQLFLLSCDGWK